MSIMEDVAESLSNRPHSTGARDMVMFESFYRDPARAALREYLANAYDAHTAKGGVLPPIQVTLPQGDTNPMLTIRDFGNGISEEEIIAYIGSHGASTRKHSNDFMGGYGLGAKSAFALGDEFFIVSYQGGNGVKARVSVDEKRQSFVDVLERFPTEESDGVLVEVAVSPSHLKALDDGFLARVFMAYAPGSVEISPSLSEELHVHDPEHFSCLQLDGVVRGWVDIELTESARLRGGTTHKSGGGKVLMVVGKAVYGFEPWNLSDFIFADDEEGRVNDSVELEKSFDFFSQFEAVHVINLPVGSVDLSYSRDHILNSKRSIATISSALTDYVRLLHAELQRKINSLPSYSEAMQAVVELEDSYYNNAALFSWRGQKLGAALIKSSSAVVREDFNKFTETIRTPVKTISHFSSFWNWVAKEGDTIVIPVAAEEDIPALNAKLERIDPRTLLRHLTPMINYIQKRRQAKFLFITETDELMEILSDCPVAEASIIEALIARQQ